MSSDPILTQTRLPYVGIAARVWCCACALLIGSESRAQETKPAPAAPQPGTAEPANDTGDDAPGVEVSVSLTDGIIRRRLPFDVPFYLTGTAGAEVTTVESRVFRIRGKALVTAVVTDLAGAEDCSPRTTGADVREVSRSSWAGAPGSSFVVLVEPLAPQRYYAFCFVTAGPVPATEIERPVRRGLADATILMLRDEAPGDLTLNFANNFQARLADAIEELGRRRAVRAVIPPGNIFHRDTRVARGSPLARLLARMVDPYQEMKNQADQYHRRLDQLTAVVGQSAKLLSPGLVTALPTAEDRLPDREQAVLSPEPFELSRFDFSDADGALKEARTATSARNDEAAPKVLEIIGELERHVRALRELAQTYGSDYDLLRDAAQQIVNAVQLEARDVVVGLGSSVLSAELNRSAYVSLDAGIAYPWRLENMVFYAGTNIYFRPVNKKAPLGRSFLSRVALTIGVTTTVHDTSRGTEDLRTTTGTNPTTNSLLLGGGLRLTPSLRLSGGALIFKAEDTNPLITRKSVKATPYVGFSIDVDLGALFKGFFPGP